MILFTFADYWWFYLTFTLFVLSMLALDLGVFHKTSREVSPTEATLWTGFWISLALVFNAVFYFYSVHKFSTDPFYTSIPGFDPLLQAKTLGLEFLTGFVIEKALAIDNIFIFAVVFSYFGIPKIYQHRVLFWGIMGALAFRGLFIALGSMLMKYHWIVVFFGALLILTGIKMFFAGTKPQNIENNFIVGLLKKWIRVTPNLVGKNFFVRQNGLVFATPLFLSLVFLELSDIIFAVDSVPAIFAITKEPLIVFTSNIFAILGLRSMYFLLSGVIDRFAYIKYGLASVLIFVGLKMTYLNELFDGKFPIGLSLGIITSLISVSIIMSIIVEKIETRNGKDKCQAL